MNLNELLKLTFEKRASDLHIKVGNPPILRIDGKLTPIEAEKRLTQEDAVGIASGIMNASQKAKFKEKNELDMAYAVPGLGRFRVNVFQQRGSVGMVFRQIPMKILNFEELMLPAVLLKVAQEQRGLVLVTGTTGSGKSTTLASMIDYINTSRTANVVTIEDPIEFLHRDKKSIVNQREIGTDTFSFSEALRSALRQDPDVILVGEMRDFETISTALTAAETGHLVLSTLHTLDAAETVNRIITVFPPYQQKQVRMQLASVIKGIISQRLVARADGNGRVPAVEVMLGTMSVREAIIDDAKTRQIPSIIAAGMSHYGMQTFDQSLLVLYRKGVITYEEAIMTASNPDDFALKVKGVQSTSDMAEEEEDLRKRAAKPAGGTAPRPAGPGRPAPKEQEAKEYTGGSQDTDFKIDRFGDK
ncbi:MAG TPA: type IV pilus twitching motility protein PilT [Bacteroidota bacterium]|nr:type IV pilus twitching motility protein PilT [Bacteroidota bacterium]HXY54181.1 type IV pilus twitching motility protein PilT [Nitrospirota bacterium]